MLVPKRSIAVGAAVLAYRNVIWALWNLVVGLLPGYGTRFALRGEVDSRWQIITRGLLVDLPAWVVAG